MNKLPKIGDFNSLVVTDDDDQVLLDGGELGPVRLIPDTSPWQSAREFELGEEIKVFVYRNSQRELCATTRTPLGLVGECACLEVIDIGSAGAFLEWGIEQHVLLPTSRQQQPVKIGQKCVVFLELDASSDRVIASTRLSRHLSETDDELVKGQAVELLISGSSTLGFKAVVDGSTLGLLYRNEVFQPLHEGQTMQGYIKDIREDGKIDLSLRPRRNEEKKELGGQILEHLKRNSGFSSLTDSSPPDEIYRAFKVSKKAYKRALSALYKQRKIVITKDVISLPEGWQAAVDD